MRLEGEVLQQLAASYALGSLGQRARRRFEAELARSVAARRAWQQWEERLARLDRELPPVRPQDATWKLIEKRLSPRQARSRSPGRWLLAAAMLAGLLLVVFAWQVRA